MSSTPSQSKNASTAAGKQQVQGGSTAGGTAPSQTEQSTNGSEPKSIAKSSIFSTGDERLSKSPYTAGVSNDPNILKSWDDEMGDKNKYEAW